MIPLIFPVNICKPELLSATYTYQATKRGGVGGRGWGGGVEGVERTELIELKDQSTL